jgi:AAA family ATP:ADP antiporter
MPTALLHRFSNIRREEVGPVLVAGLFFFCGIEALRWLFLGTVLVTLLVNPVFGWLVSRFRRIAFVSATYLFFAFGLLAFYALLELAAPAHAEASVFWRARQGLNPRPPGS